VDCPSVTALQESAVRSFNIILYHKLQLGQLELGIMKNHVLNNIKDSWVERAKTTDVPYIKSIVVAAFSKYIDLLGHPPGPMNADYNQLVETQNLYVLRVNGDVLGSICLSREGDSIMVTNLVVDPAAQGRGYGHVLINYAEKMAHTQSLPAVTLYTNVKFVDNIAFYTKIGFIIAGRKTGDGFVRLLFRKNV
jgi:N-acetylglutamate synthase-like GNAT family acetyltransferase